MATVSAYGRWIGWAWAKARATGKAVGLRLGPAQGHVLYACRCTSGIGVNYII